MARYAFSDIHANSKLWEHIKNFIQEDDELYFLGDAVDRGDAGLDVLREILDDPRIFMLRGNHEDFIIDEDETMWHLNGGYGTRTAIQALSEQKKESLKAKLRVLPDILHIESAEGKHLVLCHAGTDPWYSKRELELLGRGKDPYVWDRRHIRGDWSSKEEYKDTYVIHGHTPVVADDSLRVHMDDKLPGDELLTWEYAPRVSRYCRGHKICIDMGAFFTGRTCLFDLDTFEAIYFDEEKGLIK